MLSGLVIRIEMIDVLRVAHEFQYFSDVLTCLVASAKGNVFTGGSRFDYQIFCVCSPMEQRSIEI
jgi:hypothetical protein